MDTPSISSKLAIIRETDVIVTGGVIFFGDGHTGKTHAALNLAGRTAQFKSSPADFITKSINVEFDYFLYHSNFDQYKLTICSHLFIFPGQKGRAKKGEGLAFEDALDLYFAVRTVKEVIVLILTYNFTDINTFQNLEYWVDKSLESGLINKNTHIILLGTHLDKKNLITVSESDIKNGLHFVRARINNQANFTIEADQLLVVKISNLTREGIDDLKSAIAHAFLRVFNFQELLNTTS